MRRPAARLPLLEWLEAVVRARKARARLRRRAALTGTIVAALLGTVALPPRPILAWNSSASAPLGLYLITPAQGFHPRNMAAARLPQPYRLLAAERGYLPQHVPLIKRVSAVSGDTVCASGAIVLINGKRVATRVRRDARGRPLPWWRGCHSLNRGELFLLNPDRPDSFDARYFGVSRKAEIIGKARLIWAR